MDSCYVDMTSHTGFPHSDIHGSMLAYSSPWLFAVNHVLLRLLVPRHSPCALVSLISSLILHTFLCMSLSAFEIADFGQFALPTSFFFLNVFFLRELLFLYAVFKVLGGLKWTRTTDLTLIRRAL